MPKNQSKTSVTRDKVLCFAARLKVAEAAHERFQEEACRAESRGDLSAKIFYEEASWHEFGKMTAARDMLTTIKASTLAGSLVQIAEAMARVDRVRDLFPDPMPVNVLLEFHALRRLLYSVLAVVDAAAELHLADLVSPDFASPHLDPWVPIEERCPSFKTKAA